MNEDEAALLRRCQAGDKAAYGTLVKKYAGRAVGAAYLLLGNYEDAREASQDAFVRAWRNMGSFDTTRPFYPWYSALLRNLCIDLLRRRKNVQNLESIPEPDSSDENPVLAAERNELCRDVRRAVLELPVKHREVIVMNHFQDMTYEQMAESLDIPIGTVMSRLYYARCALREKLADKKQ